jgi:hypothetical protein
VPTVHSCSGNFSGSFELFSSHTEALSKKFVVGEKSFTMVNPFVSVFCARIPLAERVRVKMPSPWMLLPFRIASVGAGV